MLAFFVGLCIGICLIIILKIKFTPLTQKEIQESKLSKPIVPTEKDELWRKDLYRVEYEEQFTESALTFPIIGHDIDIQYRAKIFKNGDLINTSHWYKSKEGASSYADYFIKCDAEKHRKPYEWIDIVKIN